MTRRFATALALGPVGRFISGGRRSRDLWYASRLLSELTRRVVLNLLEKCEKDVTLIVPRKERLGCPFFPEFDPASTNLEPWQGPVISNKIQVLVDAEDGDAVRSLVSQAEQAARSWLAGQLEAVADSDWFERLDIDRAGYDRQVEAVRRGDFVEFYGGWSPVESAESSEATASSLEPAFDRALSLLAMRKNARVFPAATFSEPGKPKSSLDPGRDSVLIEPDPTQEPARLARTRIRRMAAGIGPNERLDAIDLLRRRAWFVEAGGTRDEDDATPHGARSMKRPPCPFPPLSRVAADAWLDGAADAAPELLRTVLDALEALDKSNDRKNKDREALFLFSSPVRDPGNAAQRGHRRARFGYDPSLLFDGGAEALSREIELAGSPRFGGPRPHDRRALKKTLGAGSTECRKAVLALETLDALAGRGGPVPALHRALGVPTSYYAMLFADGDGIGALLKRLGEKDLGQKCGMIGAMDAFADKAWKVVNDCRGTAYYVGGDELAVYLPIDQFPLLARHLAKTFDKAISNAIANGLDIPDTDRPTLSVGVVIAHRKDDLRAVRHKAEAALQEAKEQRRKALEEIGAGRDVSPEGFLAIREEPAGGDTRHTAGPLSEVVERLSLWAEAFVDPERAVRAEGDEPRRWSRIFLDAPDRVRTRELSLSLAHDLLALYRRFAEGATRTLGEARAHAAKRDDTVGLDLARAMMALKMRRSGWEISPNLQTCFSREAIRSWDDVRRTAHEILIAARINEVEAQRTPLAGRMGAAQTASRRRRVS